VTLDRGGGHDFVGLRGALRVGLTVEPLVQLIGKFRQGSRQRLQLSYSPACFCNDPVSIGRSPAFAFDRRRRFR
jgi:hypothetical protein